MNNFLREVNKREWAHVCPTDVKRQRNETDPFANVGKNAVEEMLKDLWRRTRSLQSIYDAARASAAVADVLKQLERGNSEAEDLTRLEIIAWVEYPDKATEQQIADAVQKFGKMYFFRRIAMHYFPQVKTLPPDLQAELDGGKFQYIDGAWFAHLRRSFHWMQNMKLHVSPTYDEELLDEPFELKPETYKTNAQYERTPREEPWYLEDIENISFHVADEVSEYHSSRGHFQFDIKLVIEGKHLISIKVDDTDLTWPDSGNEISDAIYAQIDYRIRYLPKYRKSDEEEWEELAKDDEPIQYHSHPRLDSGMFFYATIDWYFLTPTIASKIAALLKDE